MKIKGQKIEGPNMEIIPIPRGDSQIVFQAQAVLDFDPFEKLCPEPKPPMKMLPGGREVPDLEDKKYKDEIDKHNQKRMAWMILKSLEATEGLEWEIVNLLDSDTWLKYDEELKKAGFSHMEIMRIVTGVMDVNSLNEDKIEEARKRFLSSQAVKSPDG